MPTKLQLLYISPVIPALTGNGLAMRAGMALEALAVRFDVHLLVVPLYAAVTPQVPEHFVKLCRRTTIVSPMQLGRLGPKAAGIWKRDRFDVVHVFRLAAAPFAEPYWGGFLRRPRRHLDLDDIESVTHRRLASLSRQNGDQARAAQEASDSARSVTLEDAAFRRFDRIYVCSASDREQLGARTRAEIVVLPNAVRLPADVPAKTPNGPFTFLLVGTLGYYPNEDGARYLCAEILPKLRELAGNNFAVNIIGTGAADALQRALKVPQVCYVGPVGDLSPAYAQADVVVAPIRAGGGTRIKILEAFSFQRPVVSTSIAMEGIEARTEEHVLIGDTPQAFAQQCARLIADPHLRDRLVNNALTLLENEYTLPRLYAALAQT